MRIGCDFKHCQPTGENGEICARRQISHAERASERVYRKFVLYHNFKNTQTKQQQQQQPPQTGSDIQFFKHVNVCSVT